MEFHHINGRLDILSALCMLNIIQIPFIQDRHVDILLDLDDRTVRYVAFFYIAIGLMKMSWSLHYQAKFIALAYFVEFAFLATELYNGTLDENIGCLALGICMTLGITTLW